MQKTNNKPHQSIKQQKRKQNKHIQQERKTKANKQKQTNKETHANTYNKKENRQTKKLSRDICWTFLCQIFIFTFTQRLISVFPASRILESRAKIVQSAGKAKAAGSESRPLTAWTRVCGFRPSSSEELGDLPLIVCDLTECNGHQLSEVCLKLLKRRHVSRWARVR